jgi:hypothetical protein
MRALSVMMNLFRHAMLTSVMNTHFEYNTTLRPVARLSHHNCVHLYSLYHRVHQISSFVHVRLHTSNITPNVVPTRITLIQDTYPSKGVSCLYILPGTRSSFACERAFATRQVHQTNQKHYQFQRVAAQQFRSICQGDHRSSKILMPMPSYAKRLLPSRSGGSSKPLSPVRRPLKKDFVLRAATTDRNPTLLL